MTPFSRALEDLLDRVTRGDWHRIKSHEMDEARQRVEAMYAEAQMSAERYAQVRTWTPIVFAKAWEVNIKTGKPFDEIVDHLKPFLEPRA